MFDALSRPLGTVSQTRGQRLPFLYLLRCLRTMQPSFRSQETLTLPSSLTGYGDFGHRLNSEFISSCGAENETAVDVAITITVERVARYFQDSGREAVTSDGLCPSGGPGPRTPSWFSYDLDSVLVFYCDLTFVARSWPGRSTISTPSFALTLNMAQ